MYDLDLDLEDQYAKLPHVQHGDGIVTIDNGDVTDPEFISRFNKDTVLRDPTLLWR